MREQRKVMIGRVTSTKMDKTIVVLVERRRRHRLYDKVITMRRKFMAHDEENQCQEGDLVRIIESRPMSRHKRWVVEEIVESAAG